MQNQNYKKLFKSDELEIAKPRILEVSLQLIQE